MLEVRAQIQPWYAGVSILLCDRIGGKNAVVKPSSIKIDKVDEDALIEPTFVLSKEAAQRLFDDLWTSGFRPNNGEGSAGQTAALKSHLNDMRKIVSKHLDVKLE